MVNKITTPPTTSELIGKVNEIIDDNHFVFEQGIASDTWVIEHNLNKHPSVTVVDSSGYVRIPNDIKYDNENQVTVYLISAFTGKAFLN